MKKICIVTLGCPKNIVDSDKIFDDISSNFISTEMFPEADIILINTCGFIMDAMQEPFFYPQSIGKIKEQRNDLVIIVYGCAVTRMLNETFDFSKNFPYVDKFFAVSQQKELKEYLLNQSTIKSKPSNHNTSPPAKTKRKTNPAPATTTTTPPLFYSYIKISDGCNRECSFCTIPSIKGKYVSVPKEQIIKDVRNEIEKGKKEIILVHAQKYQKEIGERLTKGYSPKGSVNAFINRAIEETMERDMKAGEVNASV